MAANQHIGSVALLVADYDEGINFFVGKLDFELVSNEQLTPTKRFVLVRPPSSTGTSTNCSLQLAQSTQTELIGNQSGDEVFCILHTNDFWRDYNKMVARGVTFIREPIDEEYGIVAIFTDLSGNKWDLIQPKP